MILASISNPVLRAAVRRAALPEEDVFSSPLEVRQALLWGYPRLLVCEQGRLPLDLEGRVSRTPGLPTLALTAPLLERWQWEREHDELAVAGVDTTQQRLGRLIQETAEQSKWVEGFFSDLNRAVGQGPPPEFRGFARRILEHPVRYPSLKEVAGVVHLSAGALKGRFRRRDLPSPGRYLRWFRVVAAARVLSDPGVTTLAASFRLGFSSDGNFCRWVQTVSGMPPSKLRGDEGRLRLLAKLTDLCMRDRAFEKWSALDGLFLRAVA